MEDWYIPPSVSKGSSVPEFSKDFFTQRNFSQSILLLLAMNFYLSQLGARSDLCYDIEKGTDKLATFRQQGVGSAPLHWCNLVICVFDDWQDDYFSEEVASIVYIFPLLFLSLFLLPLLNRSLPVIRCGWAHR